jgi:hypothetical protein
MAPGWAKKKAATAPAWKPIIATVVVRFKPCWCFRPYFKFAAVARASIGATIPAVAAADCNSSVARRRAGYV